MQMFSKQRLCQLFSIRLVVSFCWAQTSTGFTGGKEETIKRKMLWVKQSYTLCSERKDMYTMQEEHDVKERTDE